MITKLERETCLVELAQSHPLGSWWWNDYDMFHGSVVGHYVTNETKLGLVLQQFGTKVVHVYGAARLVARPLVDYSYMER